MEDLVKHYDFKSFPPPRVKPDRPKRKSGLDSFIKFLDKARDLTSITDGTYLRHQSEILSAQLIDPIQNETIVKRIQNHTKPRTKGRISGLVARHSTGTDRREWLQPRVQEFYDKSPEPDKAVFIQGFKESGVPIDVTEGKINIDFSNRETV